LNSGALEVPSSFPISGACHNLPHGHALTPATSDVRFHDLRHTFATRLVQNGVDLYTVQKLGRWKTLSMVTRYAHHHPESLRAGIAILDKARARSTKTAQSLAVATEAAAKL
jgi:hypothetical protein